MHTAASMRHCVELVRKQHWPADLVLATGDLTHDASVAAYQQFRDNLATLQAPICAIAGNHDVSALLHNTLNNAQITTRGSVIFGQWQIILLDSSILDSEAGFLPETELQHLQQSLQQHPEHHALICLHHPPVAVECTWLDTMQLQNSEQFFNIIDQHPQVRGVLWGHIHQEYHQQRNRVQLIGSPSTCIQFKPRSPDFATDDKPPGYRWLALHVDGKIDTGVCRLSFMPDEVEMNSDGY